MPEPSLGIIVVMPCFNEPDLASSIRALANCKQPQCAVEVIIVVNFDEQANDCIKANCRKNYDEAQNLSTELSKEKFKIYPILQGDLPHKHAGVGLVRKIGMDEAAHRFMQLSCSQGIILCFDADSTCDTNYFTAVESHYSQYPTTQASAIYYEHPIEGNDFTTEIYAGIAQYELHLRYYNQALRLAELPFAYHTVGSSMACTASAYAKVGGMNKRKAGEDFYFLQKLIPHGYFNEINTTRVIPSPRVSDRVPFGTGRAMLKYTENSNSEMQTYSLDAFKAVRQFVKNLPTLFKSTHEQQFAVKQSLYPPLTHYLNTINYYEAIEEISANCGDYPAFEKRFFGWWDAFRMLKYMNWVHDNSQIKKQPVTGEAANLLKLLGYDVQDRSATALLKIYRTIERGESPLAGL